MGIKNNRETRFMAQVRTDAINRRQSTRTGEVHLTLTSLKDRKKLGGKSRIYSARTTDRQAEEAGNMNDSPGAFGTNSSRMNTT